MVDAIIFPSRGKVSYKLQHNFNLHSLMLLTLLLLLLLHYKGNLVMCIFKTFLYQWHMHWITNYCTVNKWEPTILYADVKKWKLERKNLHLHTNDAELCTIQILKHQSSMILVTWLKWQWRNEVLEEFCKMALLIKLIRQFSAIQNEKKEKMQVFNVICVKQTLVYIKTNVTCTKFFF